MPFFFFVWDDENESHLAEHGVSREEFEEVVSDPYRVRRSRSTGRPMSIGYTSEGRYLTCVYEILDATTVYPITAYEVEE
jgi:uncharacterized DUF497 family protein